MKDLKQLTLRGGVAKIFSQGAAGLMRIGCLMVLGRLLEPRDFGLIGMVMAVTGVLNIFNDFGLSIATLQRKHLSQQQLSAVFWINLFGGALLSGAALCAAPLISRFYHEPRLFTITATLSLGFLLNAAGAQHTVILQRDLRFTVLAIIEIVSLLVASSVGIVMAVTGFGYWALVGMTLTNPAIASIGAWLTSRWIPVGLHWDDEIRSMLGFGGTITLNGLVVYLGYNLEKALLGRYWGADALGVYGRAYQLVRMPGDSLNSAVGGVVIAVLAKVKDDSQRLRSSFLQVYSALMAASLPITILCALVAEDLIRVVLGPKWQGTATIFRLLTPAVLVFTVINPLGWILVPLGMVGRSLRLALAIAPIVIAASFLGLWHGPTGVALAYSSALTLWVVPHTAWAVHGTTVSVRDIVAAVSRPFVACMFAAVMTYAWFAVYGPQLRPAIRLVGGGVLFMTCYLAILLWAMRQGAVCLGLYRSFRGAAGDEAVVSV